MSNCSDSADKKGKTKQQPKVTLDDVLRCLETEALKADVAVNVYAEQENSLPEMEKDARHRARCLDAAAKMFGAILENWDQHKALMLKTKVRKQEVDGDGVQQG